MMGLSNWPYRETGMKSSGSYPRGGLFACQHVVLSDRYLPMNNFKQKLDNLIISKTSLLLVIINFLYFVPFVFSYDVSDGYLIYIAIHAYICFIIAPTKNRNPYVWGILALPIPVLAVIILKIMGPSKDGVW